MKKKEENLKKNRERQWKDKEVGKYNKIEEKIEEARWIKGILFWNEQTEWKNEEKAMEKETKRRYSKNTMNENNKKGKK